MKKAQDFKEKVKEFDIKFWKINVCCFCGYECGYVFENGEVFYDNGCSCTYQTPNLNKKSYENVAESYNMQTSQKYIKEMDAHFHF